jgi:thiol-disulfide isomerase/thioredoxin
LLFAAAPTQAGWYTDSLKTAAVIEIRGETADTAAAKAAGDRHIDDNLDFLLANNEWLIVNFCAYWCGDCNVFRPDFIRASQKKEYKSIRWATADVDGVRGNESFRKRYDLPGTPTVILFYKGHVAQSAYAWPAVLDGSAGDKSYDDLVEFVELFYRRIY